MDLCWCLQSCLALRMFKEDGNTNSKTGQKSTYTERDYMHTAHHNSTFKYSFQHCLNVHRLICKTPNPGTPGRPRICNKENERIILRNVKGFREILKNCVFEIVRKFE